MTFWRENEIAVVILLRFNEKDVVAETSPRNVGDLVFFNHKRAYLSSFKTTASQRVK